jgi:hypothetical protein
MDTGGFLSMLFGVTCLFFALLGRVGNRKKYRRDPPENAVSARRHEYLPQSATAYTDLNYRFQRSLTVIGCASCVIGVCLLIASGWAG